MKMAWAGVVLFMVVIMPNAEADERESQANFTRMISVMRGAHPARKVNFAPSSTYFYTPGYERYFEIFLNEGVESVFVSAGDNGVSKVMMALTAQSGRAVAYDPMPMNNSVIRYVPPYSGIFRLHVMPIAGYGHITTALGEMR